MAMNVAIFRHTASDELGAMAWALERTGADYSYIDTYHEDVSAFDALAPDLLIVLGGSPGVYQADDYPFIKHEIGIIEKRLAAGSPVLGICLGAQMMAKALGADVYVGERGPEIGWLPISVNERGQNTPVHYLSGEYTSMLHWHGDTFDLPKGAELLASSDLYKQAFSWGDHALALQCHIDVTPRVIKDWIVGAAGQVAQGKLDVGKIRSDTEKYSDVFMQQADRFFTAWLQTLQKEKKVA